MYLFICICIDIDIDTYVVRGRDVDANRCRRGCRH